MNRLFSAQFVRFFFVGILNTLLGFAIFNFLMWVSGVTRGIEVTIFSAITFTLVVTHSFFWNKFTVFQDKSAAHQEYAKFFTVTVTTTLINTGIVSLLVNVIGAPAGVSPALWANFALLCTAPVSAFGNFFGYSFLVFKQEKEAQKVI